eukprot:COSAG03_NODE_4270_length_1614_cov_1.907591_1_plen_344_part_10
MTIIPMWCFMAMCFALAHLAARAEVHDPRVAAKAAWGVELRPLRRGRGLQTVVGYQMTTATLGTALQECKEESGQCTYDCGGSYARWDSTYDCPTSHATYGELSTWVTTGVTSLSNAFSGASSFNGDVSSWDTSSVTSLYKTFYRASSFNGDVSSWDISSVTSLEYTFMGASSFNGDLSSWDTSSVRNLWGTFYGASSFNGDLSSWDTSSVTQTLYRTFYSSAMSTDYRPENGGPWDVTGVNGDHGTYFQMYSGNGPCSSCEPECEALAAQFPSGVVGYDVDTSATTVSGLRRSCADGYVGYPVVVCDGAEFSPLTGCCNDFSSEPSVGVCTSCTGTSVADCTV